MRTILIVLLMTLATQAGAGNWFSRGYTAEMVQPVRVEILDGAKDACWTNIGEVKTYINDKLGLANVELTTIEENENYYLSFIVDGQRNKAGFCFGMFKLKFQKFLNNGDGQIAFLVIGESGAYEVNDKNLNDGALRTVSNFFEDFLN